jgi:hypothetical protein
VLLRVELGFLRSSYVPSMGLFRIGCSGCNCSRRAGSGSKFKAWPDLWPGGLTSHGLGRGSLTYETPGQSSSAGQALPGASLDLLWVMVTTTQAILRE